MSTKIGLLQEYIWRMDLKELNKQAKAQNKLVATHPTRRDVDGKPLYRIMNQMQLKLAKSHGWEEALTPVMTIAEPKPLPKAEATPKATTKPKRTTKKPTK